MQALGRDTGEFQFSSFDHRCYPYNTKLVLKKQSKDQNPHQLSKGNSHSELFTREAFFSNYPRHVTLNYINQCNQPSQLTGFNVRYSISVIDLMPFESGTTSSSISSSGGKPRVCPSSHWSVTPQLIAYLIVCSMYPLSVIRSGCTVNILRRAGKVSKTECKSKVQFK